MHCHCIDKHNHRELLRIIAACERLSTHPIAKSICLAFGQFADDCVVTDAKNYAGMGVSAVVDGVRYYAGNDKPCKRSVCPLQKCSGGHRRVLLHGHGVSWATLCLRILLKRTAGRPLTGYTIWV